ALRQAVVRTPWYAKRKSYKVLFWRKAVETFKMDLKEES
ncbi:MATE family multidrug exporter, partial [Salmonella enterica subsp. enterica serovar Heidelberg str. CFSAN002075]